MTRRKVVVKSSWISLAISMSMVVWGFGEASMGDLLVCSSQLLELLQRQLKASKKSRPEVTATLRKKINVWKVYFMCNTDSKC